MQAIIQTGNKQYTVTKGQNIMVEDFSGEVGTEVQFDCLAILGDEPKIGQPLVEGAKVVAKVLDHTKGKKVIVSTYKRRKGYHKKQGHRQRYTHLQIADIQAG